MRKSYVYEVAIHVNGAWKVIQIGEKLFSREPQAIVRGLIEQWIIDQNGGLPGGRVVVRNGNHSEPKHLMATVRIRLYNGTSYAYGPKPVAVSYLGHGRYD